jgi:hypothetical protein
METTIHATKSLLEKHLAPLRVQARLIFLAATMLMFFAGGSAFAGQWHLVDFPG